MGTSLYPLPWTCVSCLSNLAANRCYYDCNEAPASLHSVAPVLSERVVGRQLVPRAAAIWVDGVQLAL
jgi:hypothetical protein